MTEPSTGRTVQVNYVAEPRQLARALRATVTQFRQMPYLALLLLLLALVCAVLAQWLVAALVTVVALTLAGVLFLLPRTIRSSSPEAVEPVRLTAGPLGLLCEQQLCRTELAWPGVPRWWNLGDLVVLQHGRGSSQARLVIPVDQIGHSATAALCQVITENIGPARPGRHRAAIPECGTEQRAQAG